MTIISIFFWTETLFFVLIIISIAGSVTRCTSSAIVEKLKNSIMRITVFVYSLRIWNYSWELMEISLRSTLKEFPLMVMKTGLLIWMLTLVVKMGIWMSISPPRVKTPLSRLTKSPTSLLKLCSDDKESLKLSWKTEYLNN